MRIKYLIFFLLIWVSIFSGFACFNPFSSDRDEASDYPTTIFPLENNELNELKSEFENINGNLVCENLTEYGFPRAKSFCSTNYDSVHVTSIDSIFQIAKNTVIKNRKFMNTDSTLINVHDYRINNDWRVFFEEQVYNGLKVLNTAITVYGNPEGVYMLNGNWYKNIIIPNQDQYTLDEAKNNLIGFEITFYDFAGNEKIYTINEESFADDTLNEKLVYPLKNDGQIELRVVWRITIGDGLRWHVYFDTSLGEIITVVQLFRT